MELLAGFGLIAFLFTFFIIGVIVSEYDSFFAGTLTFVVGLSALQWLFSVPIWSTIVTNPLIIVLFIAIYISVGAAYTNWWRWPNYIERQSDRIVNAYSNYMTIHNSNVSREEYHNLVTSEKCYEDFLQSQSYPFPAHKNKDRLASWVLMWPFAATWELMHKPARWVWETVYNNLGKIFDATSKNTARKLRKNSINE